MADLRTESSSIARKIALLLEEFKTALAAFWSAVEDPDDRQSAQKAEGQLASLERQIETVLHELQAADPKNEHVANALRVLEHARIPMPVREANLLVPYLAQIVAGKPQESVTSLDLPPNTGWSDIKIVVISELALQPHVRHQGSWSSREVLTYHQLRLADTRGVRGDKPVQAWVVLLAAAKRDGVIPKPTRGPEASQAEKIIQQLKKAFRETFQITENPFPLDRKAREYRPAFELTAKI